MYDDHLRLIGKHVAIELFFARGSRWVNCRWVGCGYGWWVGGSLELSATVITFHKRVGYSVQQV